MTWFVAVPVLIATVGVADRAADAAVVVDVPVVSCIGAVAFMLPVGAAVIVTLVAVKVAPLMT
jgi:hypothetical protein